MIEQLIVPLKNQRQLTLNAQEIIGLLEIDTDETRVYLGDNITFPVEYNINTATNFVTNNSTAILLTASLKTDGTTTLVSVNINHVLGYEEMDDENGNLFTHIWMSNGVEFDVDHDAYTVFNSIEGALP